MPENTVTKRDLAKAVAEQNEITHMEASKVIQSFLDQVTSELSDGNRLELRDFGVFEPRVRKGRDNARNPRTGETVTTDDDVTVKFKVGKNMKQKIQNCLGELKRRG